MSEKIIYLVRHGETDAKKGIYYGSTDYQLSEKGKRQIKDIADYFYDKKIDAIYSSPLKRAAETSQILNRYINKPLIYEPLLKEREFGIFENLSYDEIQKKFPNDHEKWQSDWFEFKVPGGESTRDCHERIKSFLDNIKDIKGNIVLVSHLGCIRSLLIELLKLKEKNMWRFRIENGRIAKIIINDEGYAYLDL